MGTGKRAIQSKTILFNMAVAVLAVIADQSDLVRGLMTPQGYLLLTVATALANTWLRFNTTQPITKGR